jgi:predicted enzyme related to lactoylglutathione lyase
MNDWMLMRRERTGQPVVHWEFWSEDPGRISEFYQKVFAWNIRALPELNYRLVETGGQGGINGGIMKPPPHPSRIPMGGYSACGSK